LRACAGFFSRTTMLFSHLHFFKFSHPNIHAPDIGLAGAAKPAPAVRAARPSLGHYYLCGPALLLGAWQATTEVRVRRTSSELIQRWMPACSSHPLMCAGPAEGGGPQRGQLGGAPVSARHGSRRGRQPRRRAHPREHPPGPGVARRAGRRGLRLRSLNRRPFAAGCWVRALWTRDQSC
jgi:hypothetical protein